MDRCDALFACRGMMMRRVTNPRRLLVPIGSKKTLNLHLTNDTLRHYCTSVPTSVLSYWCSSVRGARGPEIIVGNGRVLPHHAKHTT